MGSAKTNNRIMQGIGASPGIAIGQARIADRSRVKVIEEPVAREQIPVEAERFKNALQSAKDELNALKQQIAAEKGEEHLYVIDTHLLILEDSMLLRETLGFIENEGINAEAALKRTLLKFREFFATIEDDYLRERYGDVETVVERILRNMVGKSQESLERREGTDGHRRPRSVAGRCPANRQGEGDRLCYRPGREDLPLGDSFPGSWTSRR